jgi:hypothetical protein
LAGFRFEVWSLLNREPVTSNLLTVMSYASHLHPSLRMGTRRAALHLDRFEQPGESRLPIRLRRVLGIGD